MTEVPDHPLVAPAEFHKMGLRDFGLSSADFNWTLNSHRFVYFKARFKRKGTSGATRTEYGDSGAILNREYAASHALLSPFIMHEEDLWRSIRGLDQNVQAKYLRTIAQTQPDGRIVFNPHWGEVFDTEALYEAQSLLHRLSFTTDGFEALIKQLLERQLASLARGDASQYESSLLKLRTMNHDQLNKSILELLRKPLNFDNPKGFEAVVPVAVPETELLHFNASSRPE